MSLFQAREWWSASPDSEEEAGHGCMCVANVDNDPSGNDKIVTGSYQGMLRVYYPRQSGYQVDDLLLEKNLEEPILQLEAGRFLSASDNVALAVLHPRKLAVYSITPIKGHGNNAGFSISKTYEHKLGRTAFNFCTGTFGANKSRDSICVQSMDGQLQMLEQETFAFSRYLNNFLIPGPICYVEKTKSFMTVNSQMEVDSYKYQMLSVSSDKKASEIKDTYGLNAGKKVQVDWSLNIGETIIEIYPAKYDFAIVQKQSDDSKGKEPSKDVIVAVGEHTIFYLSPYGSLLSQQRMEYNPSCSLAYKVGNKENHNLMVASYEDMVSIYRGHLVWAAKLMSVPVALAVSKFGDLKGLVVSMNERCQVYVSYMGTDPPMQAVNSAGKKELDYEAMDEEHRNLLDMIRKASTGTMTEPTDKLLLRVDVPSQVEIGDTEEFEKGSYTVDEASGGYIGVTVKLFVSMAGNKDADDVLISIYTSPAFPLKQKSIHVSCVRSGSRTPMVIPIRFRVANNILPSSLKTHIVAAYTTSNDEPRTAKCFFTLPSCLAYRVIPPVKSCQFMFTLDLNRAPPNLMDLFPDVLNPAIQQSADVQRNAENVMTAQYYAENIDVTILVSKKNGRYRIQSSSFEALSLLTEDLKNRIYKHLKSTATARDPVKITFGETLPLLDYFTVIDQHHALSKQLVGQRVELENAAHQFRIIQKRLLVRFKDKNPAPLSHMDTLLHDTYTYIIDLGDKMNGTKELFFKASNLLSCATELLLQLIQFKYDMNEESAEYFKNFLSPLVYDDGFGQSWEARTDASMTHLLRTALAKNARDAATVAQPIKPLEDTSKLKRHIQIVCERLAKGVDLVATGAGPKAQIQEEASLPPPQMPPQMQPIQDSPVNAEPPAYAPEEEEEDHAGEEGEPEVMRFDGDDDGESYAKDNEEDGEQGESEVMMLNDDEEEEDEAS